jgi:hypothetical protein
MGGDKKSTATRYFSPASLKVGTTNLKWEQIWTQLTQKNQANAKPSYTVILCDLVVGEGIQTCNTGIILKNPSLK